MKTTYANQKAITINRNLPQKGENRKFLTVHYDTITQASRNLSGEAAFKLYLYLLSNQDKYIDNFSPANFSKEFGISVDRCRKVFSQLEEVGYLIKSGNNEYQFYEEPQPKELPPLPSMLEQRVFIDSEGNKHLLTYEMVFNQFYGKTADEDIKKFWNSLELYKEEE